MPQMGKRGHHMNSATQDFDEYWTHTETGQHINRTTMKFVLRAPGLGFNQHKDETPDFLYSEIASILKAAQAFGQDSSQENASRLQTAALDAMGAVSQRNPDPAQARFQALRTWRSEVARAKQIPPYIIATDAALRNIAARNPGYKVDLAGVQGFGPAKSETYGDAILAALRSVA